MTMPIALGLVDPEGAATSSSPRPTRAPPNCARGSSRSRARAGPSNSPAFGAGRRCRSCAAFPRRCASTTISPRTTSSRCSRTTATASIAGRRCRLWRRVCCCAAWPRSAPGAPPTPEPAFVDAYGSVVADALSGPHRPRFRGAGAQPAQRSRHRARNGGERRSRRDLPRSRRPARRARARARREPDRAARGDGRRRRPSAPTRRAPAAALCATARWRCSSRATAVEGGARAHRQFAEADNMTARLGALAAIADDLRARGASARSRPSRAASPPSRSFSTNGSPAGANPGTPRRWSACAA